MKKTVLAILLCLLTLGAWADEWSHKGSKWSTSTVEISVPSTLKVTQDSNGLLTLDNENLRVILTPLPSGLDFAAGRKALRGRSQQGIQGTHLGTTDYLTVG